MWFKLAGATFSTHLGPMSKLSNSISIKYNASGFSYTTGSVSKDDASANLVLTLNNNWTYEHSDSNVTVTGATKGSISYSSGTLTIPIAPSSGSTFGASEVSSINVTVTGAVSSGGPGGDEPEAPTNYTFTINPTPTSATVTLSATGYSTVSGTGSKSITVANGTKVNWSVSASGYTTRTGNWTINGGNKTESITLTASSGDSEVGDGAWLSVLLTGDADAHNKFMNGTLTGAGSLSVGCDVIYTATNIQSHLEGKKIYKFASNGLGENTITLYSNPYVGNTNTNTPEGRTEVGTVTSTSAQAIGTITEYTVNNPSAIKNGETLSISWSTRASGIKTVEGYNTPVYYLNGGVFKSALTSFCSFDFFVGE